MEILAKAVGRRKEAVAQVQIKAGTGLFIINNKPAQEYLQNDFYSLLSVKAPFDVLSIKNLKQNETSSEDLAKTQNHDNNGGAQTNPNNLIGQDIEINKIAASPTAESIDTIVIVKGGGLMGQTEAIRLGVSRAICLLATKANLLTSTTTGELPISLDIRKQLKDKGYLTQDSRVKERRKYGLKKARKASQYHKR